MKKLTLSICICLLFSSSSISQNSKSTKALSFEVGKTGAIANLTFDSKATQKNWGYRLFAGSNFGKTVSLINVGAGTYYLLGKANRFFEIGTDLSYLSVDVVSDDEYRFGNFVAPNYDVQSLYATFNLGYRIYSRKTLFRVGIAPGFIKNNFLPGGYISFGVRI